MEVKYRCVFKRDYWKQKKTLSISFSGSRTEHKKKANPRGKGILGDEHLLPFGNPAKSFTS